MNRVTTLVLSLLLVGNAAVLGGRRQQQQTIEVYKDSTCTCCSKWVEHLRDHGFVVRTTDTDNVEELKARHHVPHQLRSCHTALVSGYVIEGHVPAADVQRLLDERPAIRGLAVPGMPLGSPGMETLSLLPLFGAPAPPAVELPSMRAQPYDVVAFDEGGTRIFATYGR